MTYELYSQIALSDDIPEHGHKRGDVARVVEKIPPDSSSPTSYVLEVFNALGESVNVIIVKAEQIELLQNDEYFSVRRMETA
jgi:predicted thioredoxin/glutaredoxin